MFSLLLTRKPREDTASTVLSVGSEIFVFRLLTFLPPTRSWMLFRRIGRPQRTSVYL